MPVKIRIPTPLQKLTKNQAEVSADASDVDGAIRALEAKFPGIRERLCDPDGQLRRFINFYVNEEDIRFLEGAKTKLKDGDEISIIPAIAGGAYAD